MICCTCGTPAELISWSLPRRRGVISSNGVSGTAGTPGEPGSGIMGAFGLTLFQAGLLPAAFMVGLLVASPAFAEASKQWHALRLIALGLTVWLLAAAASGAAWGFYSLLAARMVVGVGEASFVALAAPFIGAPGGDAGGRMCFFRAHCPAARRLLGAGDDG